MSNTEIQSKVNELRELRRMADELTAEIESIQDAIKAHMTAIDADTLTGADYKITWKAVTSSRFDSTAFKKAMPELAERFTKSSTSRRSPETAVNVLLACWDFLETGEKPVGLSPIESVAFSAFMPDMKEAWERYIQRINAKASGNRTTSVDVE